MKSALLLAGFLVLAAGCGRKEAELERRVQKLEIQCSNLFRVAEVVHTNGLATESLATNTFRWMEMMGARVEVTESRVAAKEREFGKYLDSWNTVWKLELSDELERQLQARAAKFKAGAAPPPAPGARPAEPLREGVPISIYNQIAADVAKRYPTDFSMQKVLIDDQVQSYLKLHPGPR